MHVTDSNPQQTAKVRSSSRAWEYAALNSLVNSYLPTTSRLPPDYLPTTSRLPPDYLPTTSRLPPDHLPTTSRLPPDYLPTTSRYRPSRLDILGDHLQEDPLYKFCRSQQTRGVGVLPEKLGEVRGPLTKTLILFKNKICDFYVLYL